MEYFSILMIIFSICIFLYGFHIFKSKNPYLPYTYHGKRTKSYYKYLGKVTMIVSLAPLISGLSIIIIDNILFSMLLFIVVLILCFFFSIKYFYE